MKRIQWAALGATYLSACAPLSQREAREAMDELVVSSQSAALEADMVELTTDFTLGAAVADAAREVSAAVRSQIPCATVEVRAARVIIDFGPRGSSCIYRGRSLSGRAEVEIERADEGGVQLTHRWTALGDGVTTLDGEAVVTWAVGSGRRVVHDVLWTLADGRTIAASGDRTQSLVDPSVGLEAGILIDGQRRWTTARGTWSLVMDGVEARPSDPVPQSGRYVLVTPAGQSLTASFERVGPEVIRVTLEGPRRTFRYLVRRGGAVESVDEA